MANLLEDLRQFDMRIGKTPIDSTRIEGFGPGAPPSPPMPEQAPQPPQVMSAAEQYGEPYDEPIAAPEPPASPLVRLGQQAWSPPTVAGVVSVVPTVNAYDLFVGDTVGRYKGWEVELLENEQAQIIAVIHGAFRRRMEAQFESVTGRPMRRTRTVKAVVQKRKGRTPREHPPA